MFGATQTVDMISSLKRSYGRVEVAVLNVDLLPNSIDTVVISDRLFSLPIQVEGVMGNEVHNNPMDVDEGNPGAVNSVVGSPVMVQTMSQEAVVQDRKARKIGSRNRNIALQWKISQQRRCMALVTIRLKLARVLKAMDRTKLWSLLRAREY
jgi:hypothetical protein